MTSNSESIAHRLHEELDELIRQVSQVDGAPASAHAAEERLGQGMLVLGRGLMQVGFTAQSEAEVVQDELGVKGVR